MEDLVRDLRQTVASTGEQLLGISEAQSEIRPAPGQWSAKEILGHLIDSAANNHRRFVEAQLKDDLVFPGYDRERWVAVQRYQQAPWSGLIALWKAYNLHLAHVVAAIPEGILEETRREQTEDETAWRTASSDAPVSLAYLIRDYYGHLQAHLAQLFAACGQ
jgi:hypothetical protein